MLTYAILNTTQRCTQIEQMGISTCKKFYNLNSEFNCIYKQFINSEYMLVIHLYRATSALLYCKCILLQDVI